ncbi:unnamed protein product [Protopolystoma xenopodis]|uniref:Uncharacterized protein n=1 Tax=Protopolystoma xenopodis TaxID=117903 RepID=A0A448WIV8_9PLAT|nr:unnamed protein product [Protopolystoma xenopodis]
MLGFIGDAQLLQCGLTGRHLRASVNLCFDIISGSLASRLIEKPKLEPCSVVKGVAGPPPPESMRPGKEIVERRLEAGWPIVTACAHNDSTRRTIIGQCEPANTKLGDTDVVRSAWRLA